MSENRLHLDTDRQVFFYEHDHYYLSNFSAFEVEWRRHRFPTVEHAYHWCKFDGVYGGAVHGLNVRSMRSAHDALQYAKANQSARRRDWEEIRVSVMMWLLLTKTNQHEYVRRKLLETGDRELIENSWRDPFWGWGPNRDGKNMTGVLWMEVRKVLKANQIQIAQRIVDYESWWSDLEERRRG